MDKTRIRVVAQRRSARVGWRGISYAAIQSQFWNGIRGRVVHPSEQTGVAIDSQSDLLGRLGNSSPSSSLPSCQTVPPSTICCAHQGSSPIGRPRARIPTCFLRDPRTLWGLTSSDHCIASGGEPGPHDDLKHDRSAADRRHACISCRSSCRKCSITSAAPLGLDSFTPVPADNPLTPQSVD